MRRTFSRCLIATLSLLAFATPTYALATPAGATGSCPASCIAGTYALHYRWLTFDGHWHVTDLVLAADHTGAGSNGALPFTWSKGHGVFTMKFSINGGALTGAYVGYRNNNGGFNHKNRLGTMSNSDGNRGVWYAHAATP